MFRIRMTRNSGRPSACVFVLALMLAVLLPGRTAYAFDYSIDQVDIDATISTDGSVDVTEYRTFDFDGSYHGVYWKIPTGSYGDHYIETTVSGVGEMIGGTFVPFVEDYSGNNHTYQITDHGSYIQVKLYSAHDDESATFVIGYRDTNLAMRHNDVSELYWKFVSDGWDEPSRNVTCTVHLPVPEGKTVTPEENARAWGHGPLDASVHFQGNDVVYSVPGVGTSEFAEARIVFPDDWLSEAIPDGKTVLRTILDEEAQWAEEANAKRERARMIMFGGAGIDVVATILCVLGIIISFLRYRRTHKPQFDDKYFRDVPTNDHPAVLGAVYRGGNPSDEDFTATLMRLTDLGVIKLDLVTIESKGLFGSAKQKQDYRLTLTPKAETMELDDIDRRAIRSLFDNIGRYASRLGGDDPDDKIIYFSEIEKVAKKYPERFHDAYENWEAKVNAGVALRQFYISKSPTGRAMAITCGVASFMLFAVSVLLVIFTEGWPLLLLAFLQMGIGFLGILVGIKCKPVSEEAIEVKAKLVALRRWLKDFTRLEEAVPRDVVLWNRLLVMAVVLGVADEVIKQLKMTIPEILEDPRLARTYGWYYVGPHGSPYRSFHDNYSSAHSVSTAKLAASESSSSGGGGGGFSGGGGGGFGGGGGGGAF